MQQSKDAVEIQCVKQNNFIAHGKRLFKVGGTVAYNSTSLGAEKIPLVIRSYHLSADKEVQKRTHCFHNGVLYYGDDVTGGLTKAQSGFRQTALPTFFTMQVSGRSIVYFLTGYDVLYKYDGNGSFSWDKVTSLETDNPDNDYESAVVHLDRAWYIRRRSSQIDYSDTLNPENISSTITIGQDKDSYNMRAVLGAGEALYIFKNNAIFQLFGRTSSQFQLRRVTNKYGLACKRGICPVAGGFVFFNSYDKELYFFGGTETSIRPLTEKHIRLREIIDPTPDSIENVDMTVHNGYFRFAFQHTGATLDSNDSELIYPLDDPLPNGLPKWSLIRGTNVNSYSVWNKHGDYNELVTGRSDTGKLMYHNRGWDFDTNAVECEARTGEITASEDKVSRFNGFFIKGKPTSYNVYSDFRYFVDAFQSDRGEHNLESLGQYRTIGTIRLSQQDLFNTRIVPFKNKSRGNSISFGLYDKNNGNELEIYSFAFNAQKRRKIRNIY